MATESLPHWNMNVVYPSVSSTAFEQAFEQAKKNIASLSQLFDECQVNSLGQVVIDDELIQRFETVVTHYNAVHEYVRTVMVYINCFINTNSRDDLAQAKMSELKKHLVILSQLETRFVAWIGSLDVEALIERSTMACDHAFVLCTAKKESQHLMSHAEEVLAAELNVTSGFAWSKLHNTITSQLMVDLEVDEEIRTLPMSNIRNLAYNANRDLRRRAYEAELSGWKRVAVPLAAALNSIKGEVNVLAQRRHWQSPLDTSLFVNGIDCQILDAMLSAARAALPDFRQYLHAKARALHLDRLAWYDLFAPLGGPSKPWSFAAARDFIIEQFDSYSPRLSDFAARAFREQWIDAEPRMGKRDGAYCTSLRGEESRILTNFKPSFSSVSTLAHELGHGYHNLNLAHRTALQRSYPMTLAETASIFCETIVCQAALRNVDVQEQVVILEASLQNKCQVVVDVMGRFLFEQRVFERRNQRELSVDEFNALMLDAQRETYGDGLDREILHPYMWAVKRHYYSSGRSFYNYPYMFGLLFGLGLYARYQQDPDTFGQQYDSLLSSTGLADVATLAARFDIDLKSEAFWTASLDLIRQDVQRFEQLIGYL